MIKNEMFLFVRLCAFSSMNMVKSRLLGRNTLSSTVIGVIPKDPAQDRLVCKVSGV